MEIGDVRLDNEVKKVIPLPRGDDWYYFIARPVVKMDTFEAMCPPPQPPTLNYGKGRIEKNLGDPFYLDALAEHNQRFLDFLVVQGISVADETMKWNTVDLNDISTYCNWRTEIVASGFSPVCVQHMVEAILAVNTVSDEAIEAARNDFLAGKRRKRASELLLEAEADTIQSTESANDGESSLQA